MTGLLIQNARGEYEPLRKSIIGRYIGGRGVVYHPEYYAESAPDIRLSELDVFQLRASGRVCPLSQVVTIEYAEAQS